MIYTIYEIIWMFFLYSFLGWCSEEVYATWAYKKFCNRGFFNGALCPIYGVGIIIVVITLEPLKHSWLLLFLGSVFLTSAIELVTGFVLEKIFNETWWDYSDNMFNFHGYICLSFSIMWGALCTLVVKVLHPLIMKMIDGIPYSLGIIFITIISLVFFIDLVVTVATICKFKKKLKLMDDLAEKIKSVSNEIGINIYDGVTIALDKEEQIKENVEDIKGKVVQAKEISMEKMMQAKEISIEKMYFAREVSIEKLQAARKKTMELEELKKTYKKIFDNTTFSYSRIPKAFPKLQKGKYKEYLTKMKKIYKK